MFENKNNRTELSEIGEFGLIAKLAAAIPTGRPDTLKGIGDDAAVIDHRGRLTVVTTDLLAEGVHFDLSYHPLRHLGYKAVVVNLSDLYAMNADPGQVFVSLALSNRFSLEAVEELYEGIRLACTRYGVDLAGGDTNSSGSGLILAVTAVGSVARSEDIVYRNTARPNDLLCVTGDLGAAYAGLQLLAREKKIFAENAAIQPDLSGHDYPLERQLKPEARKDIIESLRKAGIRPTAMIDISDGLASETMHLCEQSGTGCALYEEKIPIDHQTADLAAELNLSPTLCALHGGEDYELLFTVAQADYEKIKAMEGISVIGHMTAAGGACKLVLAGGSETDLAAQGWNAFRRSEG